MSHPERWKPVVGHETFYQISNLGRIKSLITNKFLKSSFNGCGYLHFNPISNKKTSTVHRAVAQAWVSNPNKKPQINHKNGIKTDNRAENLEWVTASENIRHALTNGLIKLRYGDKHHSTKVTEAQVEEIREMSLKNNSQMEIGKIYGVNQSQISRILRGKRNDKPISKYRKIQCQIQ